VYIVTSAKKELFHVEFNKKTTVPIKRIKTIALKTQSTSIKYHKPSVKPIPQKNIYFNTECNTEI